MARRRDKGEERRIVAQRIGILLGRARDEAAGPDDDLADRYGAMSLRLASRYQYPLAPADKAQVCRKCGAFRRPATVRVRVHRNRLITTCLRCGYVHRRPLE